MGCGGEWVGLNLAQGPSQRHSSLFKLYRVDSLKLSQVALESAPFLSSMSSSPANWKASFTLTILSRFFVFLPSASSLSAFHTDDTLDASLAMRARPNLSLAKSYVSVLNRSASPHPMGVPGPSNAPGCLVHLRRIEAHRGTASWHPFGKALSVV